MDTLMAHPAAWWLALGIFLLIVEMLSGTFFFLFLGAGALLVAALVWLTGVGGLGQALLFGLSALVSVAAWWKLRPNPADRIERLAGAKDINNRLARFVGREAELVEALRAGQGRIRLDDSLWYVSGSDLPAGTLVRVVAVDGMTLRVEAV